MQPLFLSSSVEFEKTAASTQLPEDPNTWPHELLQELYKQAPYIADFSPHVVMEKVDGEQGYGLGHIEIGNQTEIQSAVTPETASASGLRQVRVPVVIKDGMLAPFDLIVTDDSKVLPLTEARLRAAIFRPQAFDVTSRTPGDQSMIGQLYPPVRQNSGFGGGGGMITSAGMGKEGSALESFLSKDILEVNLDEGGVVLHGVFKEKTAGSFHEVGNELHHHLGDGVFFVQPKGPKADAYRKDVEAKEKGKQKTAGAFQDFGDQFLDADYLHAEVGSRQGRAGKKMASGEYKPGTLDAFIAQHKTASAVTDVASALARGASTVGAQATKNTAAAKSHAIAALVRARNLAGKLKKASILEAIRPTIYESDLERFKQAMVSEDIQDLLYKNAAAVTPSLQTLMETPERPKFASHFASLVNPTVVQIKRIDEGYRVKSASHLFWQPLDQVIDRGEALSRFGEKVVIAADLNGAVTMADGADAAEPEQEHDSDMQGAQPITEPGLYKVQTPEGEEAIGYVIPNLLDIDGTAIPLSLFTNGTQATVQSDVVGVPVEGGGVDLPSADVPHGRGVFASNDGGRLQATVPLTISASMAGVDPGEPMTYRAESFSGEDVLVSCQPNIQTVTGTEDGKMLVPLGWQWVPLDKAEEIALESQEDGLGKAASAAMAFPSIQLVSGGGGTYSLRGASVAKLAHDERELLSIDDTMFLLAGLGTEQGYGVRKIAEATTGSAPVKVCVGRSIKLAADEMAAATESARGALASLPNLRQDLFKEAAALSDPQAVDAVLSLGFINPENLTTFVGYLPLLEDAQSKLCDILLASRLGSLIETPEGAIERSVRSTEAVLEGLKALAFQNN